MESTVYHAQNGLVAEAMCKSDKHYQYSVACISCHFGILTSCTEMPVSSVPLNKNLAQCVD